MNRAERRAQPKTPTIDLRADLSSVRMCLQCEPRLLLEVDPLAGGLEQIVGHEHGCKEYAAQTRREAKRQVNHGQ